VYKAAFVDTATGRDLDQVAALVGIERRDATAAAGSAVFSRRSPSPADIFIPAGARLSTADAPPAVFETVAEATLRRGELSVEAPIAALVGDARGVVAASAIAVVNRPILGIEAVENPQATRFAGTKESDDALRARVRRALDAASGATPGALLGALAGVEGLREKDVLISEDPIARPGVVEITVALPELEAQARETAIINAHEAIEATRPLGVRVLTNVAAPGVLGAAEPGGNPQDDPGDDPAGIAPTVEEEGGLFAPVDVEVTLAPSRLGLTAREREDLRRRGEETVRGFITEAGIGETLVYNRLVGALMAIEEVLDVAVAMQPQDAEAGGPRRKNLIPASPKARPSSGLIVVEVGGALVVLDVTVNVIITGAGLLDDPQTARETARDEIQDGLRTGLQTFAGASLTTGTLNQMLVQSDTYEVRNLHYKVEYQDAGVRVHQQDVELPLSGLEQIWVRRVELASETA
jgi:phage-related baseplate assembly protein